MKKVDAFPIGTCVVCGRLTTCAVNIEGTLESIEYCELHFGAWLHTAAPSVRCRLQFRGHSSDLRAAEEFLKRERTLIGGEE